MKQTNIEKLIEWAKLYSKLGYGETELSAEELYTLYINQKPIT